MSWSIFHLVSEIMNPTDFDRTIKRPRSESGNVMRLPGKMICVQCNIVIDVKNIHWMATSEIGDERPFCPSCVYVCDGCSNTFIESMAYQHDDCEDTSDSELEEDDDELSSSTSDDEITIHPVQSEIGIHPSPLGGGKH